jgi:Actinobacteria/chloroflexi VLRF1 release factor
LADRYELPPERLARWLDRWTAAHPPASATATPEALTLHAGDGASVECRPVIGGLPAGAGIAELLDHVRRERRVGVLLVRLGAHACGIFEGEALVASKVDRRLVHGRHRAGGQSQRRFERRRAGQARQSLQAAADLAARLLLPEAGRLDAVVGGGDRGAIAEVLADRRLAPLAALAVATVVDVPEPRHDVLEAMPARFRSTVVIARKPG